MSQIRTFRDLVAWQKAMALARVIYRTTEQMPTHEQFGLTSQVRRAAVSVPSNIAEGYGRQSKNDYLKFLRIARGSLYEMATQYELATDLRMIESTVEVRELIEEVDRILQGLIRSVDASRKP